MQNTSESIIVSLKETWKLRIIFISFQEVYHKSMTLKEAIKSALTILKQVMEEKLSANNVEVVTMTPGELFHMFTREQLA